MSRREEVYGQTLFYLIMRRKKEISEYSITIMYGICTIIRTHHWIYPPFTYGTAVCENASENSHWENVQEIRLEPVSARQPVQRLCPCLRRKQRGSRGGGGDAEWFHYLSNCWNRCADLTSTISTQCRWEGKIPTAMEKRWNDRYQMVLGVVVWILHADGPATNRVHRISGTMLSWIMLQSLVQQSRRQTRSCQTVQLCARLETCTFIDIMPFYHWSLHCESRYAYDFLTEAV